MLNRIYLLCSILFLLVFVSCGDDDVPEAENEEEVINEVTLSFMPAGGGQTLVFNYVDPDGEGTEPAVKDDISLEANTIYTLNVSFKNTVGESDENLTQEIQDEGAEHQIFYGWTGSLFTNPKGLGNIGVDNKDSDMNYLDKDANGLPIGLQALWETDAARTGTFRLLLKHQPGLKTATSSSVDGETDVDITWNINIK